MRNQLQLKIFYLILSSNVAATVSTCQHTKETHTQEVWVPISHTPPRHAVPHVRVGIVLSPAVVHSDRASLGVPHSHGSSALQPNSHRCPRTE